MNAIDKLKEVTKERNWHQIANDKAAQQAAAQDKTNLKKGKMSYEKAVNWLEKLGYKRTQEEVWE